MGWELLKHCQKKKNPFLLHMVEQLARKTDPFISIRSSRAQTEYGAKRHSSTAFNSSMIDESFGSCWSLWLDQLGGADVSSKLSDSTVSFFKRSGAQKQYVVLQQLKIWLTIYFCVFSGFLAQHTASASRLHTVAVLSSYLPQSSLYCAQ